MSLRADCFVTATDTGAGKTWVSAGLVRALTSTGRVVAAMKPVASGARRTRDGLRNDDALLLQAVASRPWPYELVNPVTLPDPVAPHIAAARTGAAIDLGVVEAAFLGLQAESDAVVVEGVGGWRVPLGGGHDVASLARRLRLPVILVVGLRLGCINHALLTAHAIEADGATLAGWVANGVTPGFAEAQEVVNTLSERIAAPLLGTVPHLREFHPDPIAAALTVDLLAGP